MKTEVWTAVWSVDTKIQKNGYDNNVLRGLPIAERLNLLGRVVGQAYERLAREALFSTYAKRWALLFVAPEYLFARSDREHLITEAEKRQVVLRLQAISRIHPAMVLVPGTIAWKKPAERPVDERFKLDKQTGKRTTVLKTGERFSKFTDRVTRAGMERHRLAEHEIDREYAGYSEKVRLAMEEGRAGAVEQKKEQAIRDVESAIARIKKNLGTAPERSFLARNTLYAFYNGDEVGRYHKRADYLEVFPSESDGGYVIFEPGAPGDGHPNRFAVKQIRFGVEICKDHAAGYLSQLGGDVPDLHVVVSAAVRLETGHVFVRPGSFLVHASSDPECSGVWQNTGLGVEKVDTEEADTGFGGSRLLYARLRFETD